MTDIIARKTIPYIPPADYDKVATEFLNRYFPEALKTPTRVPIEEIAKNGLGLNLREVCITEESDVYGMTIFTDGLVEIYNIEEGVYDSVFCKAKTVLIDPEAVKKTNIGCKNNTIAHECVHWFKHRYYYKLQKYSLPRYAHYCKCKIDQLPYSDDDENIMESQAIGIAPRILMPYNPFLEVAKHVGIKYGGDNCNAIWTIADFFNVSKQSVEIRLKECGIL